MSPNKPHGHHQVPAHKLINAYVWLAHRILLVKHKRCIVFTVPHPSVIIVQIYETRSHLFRLFRECVFFYRLGKMCAFSLDGFLDSVGPGGVNRWTGYSSPIRISTTTGWQPFYAFSRPSLTVQLLDVWCWQALCWYTVNAVHAPQMACKNPRRNAISFYFPWISLVSIPTECARSTRMRHESCGANPKIIIYVLWIVLWVRRRDYSVIL